MKRLQLCLLSLTLLLVGSCQAQTPSVVPVATTTDIDAAVAVVKTEVATTVNNVVPWVWMILGLYALERLSSWANKFFGWRHRLKIEKAINGGSSKRT